MYLEAALAIGWPPSQDAMTDAILDHIRIVDLSWGLAGPIASRLLAEAGADVIKVEPPSGDPLRAPCPFGRES